MIGVILCMLGRHKWFIYFKPTRRGQSKHRVCLRNNCSKKQYYFPMIASDVGDYWEDEKPDVISLYQPKPKGEKNEF